MGQSRLEISILDGGFAPINPDDIALRDFHVSTTYPGEPGYTCVCYVFIDNKLMFFTIFDSNKKYYDFLDSIESFIIKSDGASARIQDRSKRDHLLLERFIKEILSDFDSYNGRGAPLTNFTEFKPLNTREEKPDLTARGTPRERRPRGAKNATVPLASRISAELSERFNEFVSSQPYLTKSSALEQAIIDFLDKNDLNQ